MQVQLVHWTGTLWPVYKAARTCTNLPADIHTDKIEMENWLQEHIINTHHWSILEFVDFHFLIKGISRACSHQLVRHRIASYAQKSQRYVNEQNFDYVIPPSIYKNDAARQIFAETMRQIQSAYEALKGLESPTEDARFVLPNACTTDINMKVNGRALIEQSQRRLCNNAQWEIREMYKKIQDILAEKCSLIAGNMVPICRTLHHCPEGDRSCRFKRSK